MQVRLNKFLSHCGIASRREADKMIAVGKVKVNGEAIQILGYKIDTEEDKVEVNGKIVKEDKGFKYLLLNKPSGYLVTMKDPFQRPTIMDLLPSLGRRVFPVGRLDFETEGLMLLTNDGEMAYRLMHPKYKIKKVYVVKVKGKPDHSGLLRLEKGIYLEGKRTAPVKITQIAADSKNSQFRIEIHEGRKREIRRLFETIGHRVLKLRRIKFSDLSIDKLKKGHWRYLNSVEVSRLKIKVGL